MNRYFKAFILTFVVYFSALVAFVSFDKPIKLQSGRKENVISLQHLSFLEQREMKEIVEKKTFQKVVRKKSKKERVQKENLSYQKKQSIPLKKKKIPQKVEKEKIASEHNVKKNPLKEEEIVNKKPQKAQQSYTMAKSSYEEEFNKHHLREIIRLIQKNMKYPRRARSLNIQGEVVVEFTLLKSGEVNGFKTFQGHRLLKKSAIKAIKKASSKFPKVKKSLRLKVPIIYRLS